MFTAIDQTSLRNNMFVSLFTTRFRPSQSPSSRLLVTHRKPGGIMQCMNEAGNANAAFVRRL